MRYAGREFTNANYRKARPVLGGAIFGGGLGWLLAMIMGFIDISAGEMIVYAGVVMGIGLGLLVATVARSAAVYTAEASDTSPENA